MSEAKWTGVDDLLKSERVWQRRAERAEALLAKAIGVLRETDILMENVALATDVCPFGGNPLSLGERIRALLAALRAAEEERG